jgi:hypothetical protein
MADTVQVKASPNPVIIKVQADTRGLAGSLGTIGQFLSPVLDLVDGYKIAFNKILNVENSRSSTTTALEEVYKIAQLTHSPLQKVADAYVEVKTAAENSGKSQIEILELTQRAVEKANREAGLGKNIWASYVDVAKNAATRGLFIEEDVNVVSLYEDKLKGIETQYLNAANANVIYRDRIKERADAEVAASVAQIKVLQSTEQEKLKLLNESKEQMKMTYDGGTSQYQKLHAEEFKKAISDVNNEILDQQIIVNGLNDVLGKYEGMLSNGVTPAIKTKNTAVKDSTAVINEQTNAITPAVANNTAYASSQKEIAAAGATVAGTQALASNAIDQMGASAAQATIMTGNLGAAHENLSQLVTAPVESYLTTSLKAGAETASAAMTELKKIVGDVATKTVDFLTANFFKMFKSSKEAFKMLKDFAVNTFKEIAQSSIIKPMLQSGMNSVLGLFNIGGTGGAASGGTTTAGTTGGGAGSMPSSAIMDQLNSWGQKSGIFGDGESITGILGGKATLSQVMGAGMLGMAGGNLLAGLLGLNKKGGSIGGGIGAGIGMASFGPLGALLGGAAGSLLGGLIGGKPSDKTGFARYDAATGKMTELEGLSGSKYSQENVDAANNLGKITGTLSQALQKISGTTVAGNIQFDVGSRDGIRAALDYASANFQNTEAGGGQAVGFVVKQIAEKIGDALPTSVKDALNNADWSDIDTAVQAINDAIARIEYRKNFEKGLEDAIQGIKNPFTVPITSLLDEVEGMTADATEFGQLDKLKELKELKLGEIMKGFDAATLAKVKEHYKDNADVVAAADAALTALNATLDGTTPAVSAFVADLTKSIKELEHPEVSGVSGILEQYSKNLPQATSEGQVELLDKWKDLSLDKLFKGMDPASLEAVIEYYSTIEQNTAVVVAAQAALTQMNETMRTAFNTDMDKQIRDLQNPDMAGLHNIVDQYTAKKTEAEKLGADSAKVGEWYGLMAADAFKNMSYEQLQAAVSHFSGLTDAASQQMAGYASAALANFRGFTEAEQKRIDEGMPAIDKFIGTLEEKLQKIQAEVDKWRTRVDSLDSAQKSLLMDQSLSILTPEQRLAAAKKEYEGVRDKIAGGDFESIDKLPDAARTYLQLAREFYGGNEEYAEIFGGVQSVLSSAQTIAQDQLKTALTDLDIQKQQLKAATDARDNLANLLNGQTTVITSMAEFNTIATGIREAITAAASARTITNTTTGAVSSNSTGTGTGTGGDQAPATGGGSPGSTDLSVGIEAVRQQLLSLNESNTTQVVRLDELIAEYRRRNAA